MANIQKIIETLKEKPDVVYVGEYFDSLPSSHGFEPGLTSGTNYLYVAPRNGLYNVSELNRFMDGLLPQMQSMHRKPFVEGIQLSIHGGNPKGISLGYINYADVIGKRSLREERVFENSVPLDYATQQALKNREDKQRSNNHMELDRIIRNIEVTTQSETHQTVIYSVEEPLIRIVRIEPYPDEKIARHAKEGTLSIGRGAFLRDALRVRDDRGFISNWQLLKYQTSNRARSVLGLK